MSKLIKRYEIDVEELKALLKIFSDSLKEQENTFDVIQNENKKIQVERKKVSSGIDDLKKRIYEIEENFNKLDSPISKDQLSEYLTRIKNLYESLKSQTFEFGEDASKLINTFDNINKNVTNMLENFPDIHNSSLNQALSTENDIDLLESILAKVICLRVLLIVQNYFLVWKYL